jgi:hypothetical protein
VQQQQQQQQQQQMHIHNKMASFLGEKNIYIYIFLTHFSVVASENSVALAMDGRVVSLWFGYDHLGR